MKWVGLLVTIQLAVGVPSFARADEASEAREHYKKGTKAFEIGAYDEAVAEYGAAYRLRDDPALLFNLAQANRLGGHAIEALRQYRMFLMKVPAASNRSEVESRIAALQTLVEQEKRTPTPPPEHRDTAVQQSPPTTTSPQAAPATPAPAPEPPVASSHRSGRSLFIGGIVVGAAGVGLIAAGAAYAVLAQSAGDTVNHPARGTVFKSSLVDTLHLDQRLEATFLAVGGAAVVTGAALAIVGWRRSHPPREHQVQVIPAVSHDHVGLVFERSF